MSQTLIQSYGLFWQEKHVFWGKPRNAGALLGRQVRAKKNPPIDFRTQRGVYALYADYELVYIGQNLNQDLHKRLKDHLSDDLSGRWNQFSWYGVRRVTGYGSLSKIPVLLQPTLMNVLNHIEAVLIHVAEPPLNRQGGKFGKNIQQFIQYRDDRLGQTAKERMQEVHEQLARSKS